MFDIELSAQHLNIAVGTLTGREAMTNSFLRYRGTLTILKKLKNGITHINIFELHFLFTVTVRYSCQVSKMNPGKILK